VFQLYPPYSVTFYGNFGLGLALCQVLGMFSDLKCNGLCSSLATRKVQILGTITRYTFAAFTTQTVVDEIHA